MRNMLILLIACFSCAVFAETGKIKICRHPGFTEMLDRQKVLVPVSSSFTAVSQDNSDFVVTTIADATLGAKPGCAVVTAELTENQGKKTATRKSGRLLAQFVTAGASLEAFIVEDFK